MHVNPQGFQDKFYSFGPFASYNLGGQFVPNYALTWLRSPFLPSRRTADQFGISDIMSFVSFRVQGGAYAVLSPVWQTSSRSASKPGLELGTFDILDDRTGPIDDISS